MKAYYVLVALSLLLAGATQSNASTLFGATSSGHGELYILNPATGGIVTDVGPLNDSGAANYSVSGLAFNPLNGVLYGSTGTKTGTLLITINPTNALVTVIGSFNIGTATMTDLAFDSAGNLYGISSTGGANLYSINISTGQATEIGASGLTFTEGGGLAISSGGIFYSGPIPGEYGTYDPTTGAYTHITTPVTPAGAGSSFVALAFDGAVLYGDNLNATPAGAGATHLVTIDPPTGTVTDIGASVTHLDAIVFQPALAQPTLTIALKTNTVLISWSAPASFRLQQNTNLTTTNWVAYTNSIAVNNGTNQVSLPAVVGNMFFRLVSP